MPEKKELRIDRKPVNSTNIVSVGYDDPTNTLDVEFYSGTLYRYADVPRNVYERLISAESVGSFFQQNVKKTFQYKRIV